VSHLSDTIHAVFKKHNALFGENNGAVFNTAITLWAFTTQLLCDGKQRSCSATVSRVIAYCKHTNRKMPSVDTGNYCSARGKLSPDAIRELVRAVDVNTRNSIPEEMLWHGRHVKLVDGFSVTMPATDENLEAFPHPKTQKEGVGLPIVRACTVTSLATGCVVDAAYGPYMGKETGETALLREMLSSFGEGDISVLDRHYSSYSDIAILKQRGVDVCTRMHQRRKYGAIGQPINGDQDDMLVRWHRQQRPAWMSEATYATIPETLDLRVVRRPPIGTGEDSEEMIIVTTLLDADAYPPSDIIDLYGDRWYVELDIRDLESTLNLDHMRCKSPHMIEREFYATLLGYNLIRQAICQSTMQAEEDPPKKKRRKSGKRGGV
jgi:putative transposase